MVLVVIIRKERMINMEKKIYIEGMSCSHCVKRVTESLKTLEGVKKVEVSLKDKLAKIESDKPLSNEDLINAVDDAGYIVNRIE
jgi:copper ion binding protein